MRTRKIVQSISAGIVLGGEAIGALVIHESHSLAAATPAVIAVIILTVWLLDTGLDLWVKNSNRAADLIGARPRSKVKIHGYWYSAIRDRSGNLLGGSVFSIQAEINSVTFSGIYKDLTTTTNQWTWWSGEGAPFGYDAILYAYWGVEDGNDDEGYGKYIFPRGGSPQQIVRGSFYGKNLPDAERDRTAHGERVPKATVTREFIKDVKIRKEALERYIGHQPQSISRNNEGQNGELDPLLRFGLDAFLIGRRLIAGRRS